jgi:hypothetical protein
MLSMVDQYVRYSRWVLLSNTSGKLVPVIKGVLRRFLMLFDRRVLFCDKLVDTFFVIFHIIEKTIQLKPDPRVKTEKQLV